MFIPWWQVLRLSGEHVHSVALDDATSNATLWKRYGRRIDALEAAGYLPAGEHGNRTTVTQTPPLPSHRPPHYRHTENWSEMAKGLRSTGAIGVFSVLNRLRKCPPYEPMYLIGEYAGAYRLR